jgi:two-component system capsular synthesis response regulator RcsB
MNLTSPWPQTAALMDSHPLALFGLSTLIHSIAPTCNILITESSLDKISEAMMYQSVDILITDMQSVEESLQQGVETLLQLGSQYPNMNMVVYTFCHDSQELWKLFNQQNISLIARGESMADTED